MSSLSRGFVRDSRFGEGAVIKGTNRETSRKWRALGVPDAPKKLVEPGQCEKCQRTCCLCEKCVAHRGGKVCPECSGISGVRSA